MLTVYNADRYLSAALASIVAQTLRDFELVVVDDGSTDGSQSIIREYQQRDERLRPYYRDHYGRVESLNFGCSQAVGKYLALMDADDISLPSRLAKQLRFLKDNPTVGVLGGDIVLTDENGNPRFGVHYPTTDRSIRRALAAGNAFAQPAVMMRKDVFEKSGRYRAAFAYAEDYDLWLRASEQCELANLPTTLIRYRFHKGGISFRNVKQQVLSMVGAELSARVRRCGGEDLLATRKLLTLADLDAQNQRRNEVQGLILERSASRAAFFVSVGESEQSLQLLDWADAIAGTSGNHHARAKSNLARAVALRRKGLGLPSFKAAVSAVWLDPGVVVMLGIGRLLQLFRERFARTPWALLDSPG